MDSAERIIKEAVEHYGEDAQILKLVEECGELSTAAMHYRDRKAPVEDFIDELADVQIMIWQMGIVLERQAGTSRYDMSQKVAEKLDRLKERIG